LPRESDTAPSYKPVIFHNLYGWTRVEARLLNRGMSWICDAGVGAKKNCHAINSLPATAQRVTSSGWNLFQ
jgi:hypothetical protein